MKPEYSKVKSDTPLQTRVLNGYQQFLDPKTDTWVFVHRRVVEKAIGGKIRKGMVVHHRDGDKSNNRAANLDLVTEAEHTAIHFKGKPNRPIKKDKE